MSRETADADAQISQLLETMQNQKGTQAALSIDSEKMTDFIKTLSSEAESQRMATTEASSSVPPGMPITPVPGPSQAAAVPAPSTSKLPSELTSGTTGFQASFLNSIASNQKQPLQQGEEVPAVSSSTASPLSPTSVSMGGGAASQMRALPNLPPNTRLVKGPNGQLTLQKVQTVELSLPMQQVRGIYW